MSAVEEIFKDLKDEGGKLVKDEFNSLLNEGLSEKDELIKDNAKKVQEWVLALATKKLTPRDFEALIAAQKRKMEQYINTKEIQVRAQAEKLALGLLDLALKKVLPLIIPV